MRSALRPAAHALPLELIELAEDAPAATVREVSAVGHSLQSLRQLARLPQFTHLRSLVLHGGPLRSLEGLAACAASLEELNLSGNELGVIAGLGALPKLKNLNLVREAKRAGKA
jgi:Leucine-rich repeat (LRR) protein